MSRPPPRRFVPPYMSEWADPGEWPSTNRRPFRAYLLSNRVRLGFPRSPFVGNWVADNYGVTYMTALPEPASCYAPRDAPVTPGRYRGFYEQEPTTGEGVPSQCHRRPGLSRLWAESQFWNQG